MMVPLVEYKLDSFYQGNGKTKHVRDFVETNIFPTVIATEELNKVLKSIQTRGLK